MTYEFVASEVDYDITISEDSYDITLSLNDVVVNDTKNRVEIENLFKVAYSTKYAEYTYDGGNLTTITVWDTASKTNKLFTKSLSYTGSDLTGISIKDEIRNKTLTKTLSYSLGNLVSKTEAIT